MKFIDIVESKIINFLDGGVEVDARMPAEETEEQRIQREEDVRQALELMRRQERMMERRS